MQPRPHIPIPLIINIADGGRLYVSPGSISYMVYYPAKGDNPAILFLHFAGNEVQIVKGPEADRVMGLVTPGRV